MNWRTYALKQCKQKLTYRKCYSRPTRWLVFLPVQL